MQQATGKTTHISACKMTYTPDFFEKNKTSTAEQIYKNRDKIETKYFNNTTGDL